LKERRLDQPLPLQEVEPGLDHAELQAQRAGNVAAHHFAPNK